MDDREAMVAAYVEAMGDWGDLDPRIFAPTDEGDCEPMCDQLARALLVAATLEAGDDGLSFDHYRLIVEDVRRHIKALSVLRGALTGACGLRWDDEASALMFRLVDSPDECRGRRAAIAAVLRFEGD